MRRWEAFFNGDSLKQRLMARYMYEHLFLANLPEQFKFFDPVGARSLAVSSRFDPTVFARLLADEIPRMVRG